MNGIIKDKYINCIQQRSVEGGGGVGGTRGWRYNNCTRFPEPVGRENPHFKTTPAFQIVKLTFSVAAAAGERGVINSFFWGVVPCYVSLFLAAFKVIMLAGCCPRGLLHLINLSWRQRWRAVCFTAHRNGERTTKSCTAHPPPPHHPPIPLKNSRLLLSFLRRAREDDVCELAHGLTQGAE